jgi:hypothetical protein
VANVAPTLEQQIDFIILRRITSGELSQQRNG